MKKNEEVIKLEKSNSTIQAPLEGNVYPLENAQDEAFASGALGKGVVIVPTGNEVVAPFDGEVVTLFPTKHAIGIISDTGVELLIHIGINTVEMNGDGFESFVQQGERVKAGQLLVRFDSEKIKERGFSTQTMIIVTNSNNYKSITKTDVNLAHYSTPVLKLEA